MNEAGYQKKIIDGIKKDGGEAFTGSFPTGQADIVGMINTKYIAIEVKTPENYKRVMRCVHEEDGLYVIDDNSSCLKEHEFLQITKLNNTRKRGGLALLAHNYEQVKDYVSENIR